MTENTPSQPSYGSPAAGSTSDVDAGFGAVPGGGSEVTEADATRGSAVTGGPVGDATTGSAGPAGAGRSSSLADDAASVASDAGDAGHRVVDVAKEEGKAVVEETAEQARRLADDVTVELREQAAVQQKRVAGGLRSAGAQFTQMADQSSESGYATDLVREAGRRADDVARWLDARDPGSLVQEVKTFARRRPGAFLAIAVGAGVVVGRLTRALATPPDRGSAATEPRASSTSAPVTGMATAPATAAGMPGADRSGSIGAPSVGAPGGGGAR
ncbi:hypothetical protein ASD23_02290 [Agromyces sp. Root1464]|uniref:hypothetical protein n=1 Tax=Agromyces sp. Root1464 TaxID=1736467 RepID=UPI0006FFBA05|nr:hypothetical protein [Agromyces sp. Root1464]KQZ10981.1 hypothetical protein ASD23_02290 [Agromyces sp. Root1464]